MSEQTDRHNMPLLEPAPALALPLSDLFPASRYDGSALMPAGAVCSLLHDMDGCFVGLGSCACSRQIGTIGYRLVAGGPVLCWGCYVQAMRRAK